jgi:hypothetical protein
MLKVGGTGINQPINKKNFLELQIITKTSQISIPLKRSTIDNLTLIG